MTRLLYENKGNTQILGYCDTDWIGCAIDRRFTTGYCLFIKGNIISLKSKKQNIIVQSSVEVECRSMAFITCELVFINQILQEIVMSSK